MKKFTLSLAFLLSSGIAFASEESPMSPTHQHHHNMGVSDNRIPLNLSPEMKQHQLSNMREHVVAIRTIIGFIAENNFSEAAQVAHSKLGLTPEMQQMCSNFGDEKFKSLGFAFHKSGDDLGDALQTKDTTASLRALNTTMGFCVSCHAAYRQ